MADTGGTEWMTVKGAAEHLKVSEPTIYRWMKDGILSFYKIGDSTRFKRSNLDEVMEKHTGEREATQRGRRCINCGEGMLVEGRVQSTGLIYFKPDKTKFFTLSDSNVRTRGLACPACGYVHLYVDTEKMNKLKTKEE